MMLGSTQYNYGTTTACEPMKLTFHVLISGIKTSNIETSWDFCV